jgi:manganese efflux pump family protein
MGELLILGITLSLDNLRTAILLGGLRLNWPAALKTALVFGFWDGMAPLIGILVGGVLAESIGSTADYIGAAALLAYGAYLILVASRRDEEQDESDLRWALWGLPLPLSIDNVVAGASLGLLGYSPWIAPPLFGAITAVMTIIGLYLGRFAARFINVRAELLTGWGLIVSAVLMLLGLGEWGE